MSDSTVLSLRNTERRTKTSENPSEIGFFYHFPLTFSRNQLLYLLLMSPENEIIETIETE